MRGNPGMRPLEALALFSLCMALVLCLLRNSHAADHGGFHVSIGFSSKAFVNAPREDLKIALRLLSQRVARKTVGSAEARIYDAPDEISRDLRAKRLDVVALTPEDFLDIGSRIPLEPIMVTSSDKGHDVDLILLVRRDSGIRSFRDLRNRSIAVPARVVQYGSVYFTWIETLVMREGFRSTGRFFAAVGETKTASLSLMQVFFRKADACVVSRQVLELASELNPQLARELKVVEQVNNLAGGIIAIRPDLREDRKQRILNALRTLHEDPEGHQMFVMFQLSRLIPYRPEYLRATRAFFEEHRLLAVRTGSTR